MSTPASQELIHAYRHLYRGALRAVKFSKPARFVVRDRLRQRFRKGDLLSFQQEKINNTLEFLQLATQEAGLEHKIFKTMIHTIWWENKNLERRPRRDTETRQTLKKMSKLHYDMTVAMLNDSMDMCL